MNKLGTGVIVLLASLCFAQNTPAPSPTPGAGIASGREAENEPKIDPAKEANIRRLLTLTGADSMATQMMTQMESSMKPLLMGTLPPGDYRSQFIELFFEKLNSQAAPRLIALAVPIYAKYFTDDEIQQLITFYQSPIGKKSVSVLPQLMVDLQESGEMMGQKLAPECLNQVLAEHPEFKQAMQEAGGKAKPQ